MHILNEHIGILYLIEAQTETETFLKIGISKFTNCNKRLNNIKKDFRHANKGMDIQLK